jgi:hypothetical protein
MPRQDLGDFRKRDIYYVGGSPHLARGTAHITQVISLLEIS